jgi:hypothetical protein
MSITPVADAGSVRRVRHQAREAAALMAFSAATSVAIAGALVLLAHWGR